MPVLRRLALMVGMAFAIASCTSTEPQEGPTQLQMQTQLGIQSLGIWGADVEALSTSDLATINHIISKERRFTVARARVTHILRNAGAI